METIKTGKKLSRRNFLKAGTVGAAATAAAGISAKINAAKEKLPKTKRLAMVIDLRKCYGCHACSIACKAEFDVPLGFWRAWVTIVERGTYPQVIKRFLPRLCNHCENAPCVEVCPTRATYQRVDGLVMQDDKKCIGCKSCIAACPYDSRFRHPHQKVARKCDFCLHRIDKGYAPSCVNTCPANARIFGDLNDPESEVSKLVSSNPIQILRPDMQTHPHVFYIGLDSYLAQLSGRHNYRETS